MDTNTGAVDHDDVTVVALGDRLGKPISHAGFAPADEAVVAGGRRTIAPGSRPKASPSETAIESRSGPAGHQHEARPAACSADAVTGSTIPGP